MKDENCRGCGNYGPPVVSRRDFLHRSALGIGSLALATLLADEDRLLADDGGRVTKANGKARNVIFLFMGGGPSHVDTFDPKEELGKLQGKAVPESIAKQIPMHARLRVENIYPSPYEFKQYGRSGIPVSSL